MSEIRSIVRGVGAYLPERILTNAELAKMVDTSDEWIKERTGISQRHIIADDELTSDLALAAARQALDRSGLMPIDIDLVIMATTTPDHTFPASACTVQASIVIKETIQDRYIFGYSSKNLASGHVIAKINRACKAYRISPTVAL